jgi:hypothetical protein
MTDPTSLPSFAFPPPHPVPPPQHALPTPQHALRNLVVDALIDEGHEPTIDEDGDVALRVQDQMVFVRCVDSEPPLMRVFGQWLLDESLGGDELVRLRAANVVTGGLNLVKVTVEADRLSAAADLIVAPGLEMRSLLTATLDAVLGSVRTWHQVVTQLQQT